MSDKNWVISVPVADLIKANKERVAHHKERTEYWRAFTEEARQGIKDSVEVVETIDMSNNTVFAGANYRSTFDAISGAEAKADPVAIKLFNDARAKFHGHVEKLRLYEEWAAFFGYVSPQASLECTIADLRLFRIGNYSEPVSE